jgi:transposase
VAGYFSIAKPAAVAPVNVPPVKRIRIKPDKEITKQRKSVVEHPFGTIKRNMDSGYCLTRRLKNVVGEFSLTFLAYNLKRTVNIPGCGKPVESMA